MSRRLSSAGFLFALAILTGSCRSNPPLVPHDPRIESGADRVPPAVGAKPSSGAGANCPAELASSLSEAIVQEAYETCLSAIDVGHRPYKMGSLLKKRRFDLLVDVLDRWREREIELHGMGKRSLGDARREAFHEYLRQNRPSWCAAFERGRTEEIEDRAFLEAKGRHDPATLEGAEALIGILIDPEVALHHRHVVAARLGRIDDESVLFGVFARVLPQLWEANGAGYDVLRRALTYPVFRRAHGSANTRDRIVHWVKTQSCEWSYFSSTVPIVAGEATARSIYEQLLATPDLDRQVEESIEILLARLDE